MASWPADGLARGVEMVAPRNMRSRLPCERRCGGAAVRSVGPSWDRERDRGCTPHTRTTPREGRGKGEGRAREGRGKAREGEGR
eukprot:3688857-Prymnesium_polylepis.1